MEHSYFRDPLILEKKSGEEHITDHVERVIYPEIKQAAKRVLLDTMGIKEDVELTKNNFEAVFAKAVGQLSRYKELEIALQTVSQEAFSYELFKLLSRASDRSDDVQNALPRDGVFLSSIEKSGILECSGRTLLASELLSKRKINYAVAIAPGHSFVVLDLNNDTLGYMDANNDIYFTFPKNALVGYVGSETVNDCKLQPYTPRPNDQFDGTNSVFTHFVTAPAFEGVARQYFGNVAAALSGHVEFVTSNIEANDEQKKTVEDLEELLLGEPDKILSNFLNQEGELQVEIDREKKSARTSILQLWATHPDKEIFSAQLAILVQGEIGKNFPYIQNATQEKRLEFGLKIWTRLQNQKLLGETSVTR